MANLALIKLIEYCCETAVKNGVRFSEKKSGCQKQMQVIQGFEPGTGISRVPLFGCHRNRRSEKYPNVYCMKGITAFEAVVFHFMRPSIFSLPQPTFLTRPHCYQPQNHLYIIEKGLQPYWSFLFYTLKGVHRYVSKQINYFTADNQRCNLSQLLSSLTNTKLIL